MSRSSRLRRKAEFLKALKAIPKSSRNILIQYLSAYACNCLFECTYNILHKPHSKKIKGSLKNHKNDLRFLGDLSKDFVKRKNRLVSKSDSLLPLILKTSIPTLLKAISHKPPNKSSKTKKTGKKSKPSKN